MARARRPRSASPSPISERRPARPHYPGTPARQPVAPHGSHPEPLPKNGERGLTTAAANNTEPQIFGFIMAAGFSTADKVTDLSGRGVGLDVVRRNMERLRGCIDIDSAQGRGTKFKLTLPLTLAIIDGLIVKVGDGRVGLILDVNALVQLEDNALSVAA